MENIKTAVSINKSLFEEAEKLARKMRVPRSRLFAIALEDYIQKEENRRLLNQINHACGEESDPYEARLRREHRRQHRRLVEGKW